jgi:hypothetical protein
MRRTGHLACVLLPLCLAARLPAQTAHPFSLQTSVLYVIPGGDAFSDTESGVGFEGQLRWNISQFSLGAGVQFSSHDVLLPDPLTLLGAFVEPRYVFPGSNVQFTPYVSGRVAIFQQHLSNQGVTSSGTGSQLNLGGGLLILISRNVNADLGATFGMMRFGSFSGAGAVTTESLSGTNLVLRAGLAIGLGSTK